MKKFLTIVLTLVSMQVFAQTNPITGITISLPANPDANVVNWGTGTSLLMISATSKSANGRIDPHIEESRILLFIKRDGKKVCGDYTSSSAPQADFNTATKVWSGNNATSFLGKSAILPPGDYELSVQFFGNGPAGTIPLSEEKTKLFTIRGDVQQGYPITGITISLPANPDANVANWGTGTSLMVISASTKPVNGRINPAIEESRILVIIKRDGKRVCGAYTSSSAPSADFNTATKVWSGNNAASFLGKGCTLPPGDYELSVQFFGNGPVGTIPLSDEKIKPFTIRGADEVTYQAPQIISPANNTIFKQADLAKPIRVKWIGLALNDKINQVDYWVNAYQLRTGQTSRQAINANQLVFTKDVKNITETLITNLVSGPCDPPMICDFVLTVQALDREGKPIGPNNGTSEISTFKFDISSTTGTTFPPKLVSPANGAIIRAGDLPTFVFQDGYEKNEKRRLSSPRDAGGSKYRLKIVEIIGDQSPENAFRTNKPIFEKDSLNELTFQYPSSASAFIAGKRYAWAVQGLSWGDVSPELKQRNNVTSKAFAFKVTGTTGTPAQQVDLEHGALKQNPGYLTTVEYEEIAFTFTKIEFFQDGKLIASTTTDKNGKFTVRHLPDGLCTVKISKSKGNLPKTGTLSINNISHIVCCCPGPPCEGPLELFIGEAPPVVKSTALFLRKAEQYSGYAAGTYTSCCGIN